MGSEFHAYSADHMGGKLIGGNFSDLWADQEKGSPLYRSLIKHSCCRINTDFKSYGELLVTQNTYVMAQHKVRKRVWPSWRRHVAMRSSTSANVIGTIEKFATKTADLL